MQEVTFTRFGDPAEVLEVVEIDAPDSPKPGEVVVQVEYSPVNMHDIYRIKGFLAPPALPAVPGNEGVARVVEVGDGVVNVSIGDLVVLPLLSGAWRERLGLPARGLFALPETKLEQLSMIGSNTPTASLILSEFVNLQRGDWVVQSGSNGGVGLNLVVLAKKAGLRTINFVRREEAVAAVKAAGGDIVVVDHDQVADEIREQIGTDARVKLAADSVGGDVALSMIDLLEDGGRFVSYNSSSGTPVDEEDERARSKNVTVTRFFVGAFDNETKVVPAIREAAPLIADGTIEVPIAAIYALEDVVEAISHVERGGKVLLRIAPRDQPAER